MGGRKLITTMFIKNVTTEDDTSNRDLGRYECWAFRNADDKARAKHGFSVDVILSEHACCFMSHCVDNVHNVDNVHSPVYCLGYVLYTYMYTVMPQMC